MTGRYALAPIFTIGSTQAVLFKENLRITTVGDNQCFFYISLNPLSFKVVKSTEYKSSCSSS